MTGLILLVFLATAVIAVPIAHALLVAAMAAAATSDRVPLDLLVQQMVAQVTGQPAPQEDIQVPIMNLPAGRAPEMGVLPERRSSGVTPASIADMATRGMKAKEAYDAEKGKGYLGMESSPILGGVKGFLGAQAHGGRGGYAAGGDAEDAAMQQLAIQIGRAHV